MNGRARLVMPARSEYLLLARLATTGVARAAGATEEDVADLKLAVTEAVANVVRHAYADGDGPVVLELAVSGASLEVTVTDEGRGFDPGASAAGRPAGVPESGMGLSIVRTVAGEVEIGPGPDGVGTRLRFTRRLAEDGAER